MIYRGYSTMREQSTRQSEAMRARLRRMRSEYRRRMVILGVILFILGVVAGIFAQRWYAGTKPDVAAEPDVLAEITVEPTEEPAAEAEGEDDFGWDLFDGSGEVDAAIFPEDEVEPEAAQVEGEPSSEDVAFPEVEASAEEEPEVTSVPVLSSDEVPEYDPTAADVGEEYINLSDEFGQSENEGEAETIEEAPAEEAPSEETSAEENPAEETPAEEAPVDEPPVEETSAEENPVEEAPTEEAPIEETPAEEAPSEEASVEGAPAEEATVDETPAEDASADEAPVEETPVEEVPAGPQVIAIVPFGESFTYNTQIKSDGTARVEATDEPYETVSFTQTMKTFMRPTDFANKYSTQYKLQGNEAGAGFELVLNDYTGEATVVPQNVVDISLRSESGNTVERGYQLMDAEIAGNYNVALNTNVPQMLYKRYQYANTGEEMFYLVVTTYNDGVAQQILFQLESDEPEPEPEIVYGTLQRGIKSDEVKALQQRLVDLGYLTGSADGSFGQMTEDAIKAAQEAFGMEANGIADNAFQQKLYEGVERPTPEAVVYETLNTSSTGEKVVNLQLRLRELGYYDGKADGGFGAMTEAAVKKAQSAYGMEQTGVADDAFQQKLYSPEQ